VAQIRAVALTITKFGIGILAFALFMWTPGTGKGTFAFFSLLVALIILAVVLTKYRKKERESYDLGS
jgi:hypothetical protein